MSTSYVLIFNLYYNCIRKTVLLLLYRRKLRCREVIFHSLHLHRYKHWLWDLSSDLPAEQRVFWVFLGCAGQETKQHGVGEWRENKGGVRAGRKVKFYTLASVIKVWSWLKSCQVYIGDRETYFCLALFYLQNENYWTMITQKCFTWKPWTLIILFWIHTELLMVCWKACFGINHFYIGTYILTRDVRLQASDWTPSSLSCLI